MPADGAVPRAAGPAAVDGPGLEAAASGTGARAGLPRLEAVRVEPELASGHGLEEPEEPLAVRRPEEAAGRVGQLTAAAQGLHLPGPPAPVLEATAR